MKWHRIPKENSKQPNKGAYPDWKEIIAEECFHQCIYCTISENRFGGIRNFHVEHYRPRSKFKELENDIKNLYYACAICNTFKGSDWPEEPASDYSNISYPDPSLVDYCEIFSCYDNGKIEGLFKSSKYMVEKLFLNRPQLLMERRWAAIIIRYNNLISHFSKLESLLEKCDKNMKFKYCKEYCSLITEFTHLQIELNKFRPYSSQDITKKIQ